MPKRTKVEGSLLSRIWGNVFGNRISGTGENPTKPRVRLLCEQLEERLPLNSAPIAVNDGPYSVLHGQSVLMDLKANDSDADGDLPACTVMIVDPPEHGMLYQNPSSGTWTYTAHNFYAGPDSFTYKLHDGQAYSGEATVTLNVTNSAPVAVNDGPFSVLHGQAISGLNFKINDHDPDGDSTSLRILTQPSHGTLLIT